MGSRWLVLAAYTCSGLAGLIYQVSWTRLLTLYMGHTIAAASTVVAAFMGGLGGGAILGARVFVLIPTLGISGTTLVGVAASGLAIIAVLAIAHRSRDAAAPELQRRRAAEAVVTMP